jgi:hypothetical protein
LAMCTTRIAERALLSTQRFWLEKSSTSAMRLRSED